VHSGFGVEGSDAAFDHGLEHQVESADQCNMAAAFGHGEQTKANFAVIQTETAITGVKPCISCNLA
jgi:hypothetical protein